MHKVITIIGTTSLLIFILVRGISAIAYEQNISGHLKLAADANSTELAEKQLKIAIDEMERLGLCNSHGDECFTSIIYRTPNEDVGFWRSNIESTFEDLSNMSKEERANNLIESNQLIKVRETLLDAGERGDNVTDPAGISIYPNNGAYAVWGILSFIFTIIGIALWMREDSYYRW